MFNPFIERASSIVARLVVVKQAIDEDRYEGLGSPQTDVAWSEVNGWFNAADSIIVQAFGEDSPQIQKWRKEKKSLEDLDRREAQKGAFDSVGSLIRDFGVMNGLLIEYQDIYEAQLRKLEMERKGSMPITISGGTFIGSQIGGVANSMDTYVEQLRINEYSSNEERELSETPTGNRGDKRPQPC